MAEPPAGYSFELAITMAELRAKLAALGHGDWIDWESAVYGDYLRGTLWGVPMRIFDGVGMVSEVGTYDPAGRLLLDYGRSQRGVAPDPAHHARIVGELFPALGITSWSPDDGND